MVLKLGNFEMIIGGIWDECDDDWEKGEEGEEGELMGFYSKDLIDDLDNIDNNRDGLWT